MPLDTREADTFGQPMDAETLMMTTGNRVYRMVVRGLNINDDVVCVCDCGETEAVDRDLWISGKVGQCSSCDEWENVSHVQRIIADPETYDALMSRALGAKDRCENPKNSSYADYGGRGITFDFRDPEHFVLHMWLSGWRIGDPRTTDRIDVNGPYSADNTRLAMPTEQARNRRITVVIDTGDTVISLASLAEQHGITPGSNQYSRLSSFVAQKKSDNRAIYDQIMNKISEITQGDN